MEDLRSIYIDESDDAAWEHSSNGAFARSFAYLIKVLKSMEVLHLMKHDPDYPDDEVTPEYLMEYLYIIGSVEMCTRELQEFYDAIGGFGTLLMIAHDWDSKPKWWRCMELLAREVVPALP